MPKPSQRAIAVGLRVPDAFGLSPISADDILARCRTLGVGTIELGAAAIEAFLGVPAEPALLRAADGDFETGLLEIEQEVLQETLALGRQAFTEQLRGWRTAVPLTRLDALRRAYTDAGVRISVINWPQLVALTDDEIHYSCRVARALGATIISTDFSSDAPMRLGPFADVHHLRLGLHGDPFVQPADLEAAFSVSPAIGAHLDLGQWAAGGHGSPLPFLAQHVRRITGVRLADRRMSDGAHTWFGQGDARIREVLQAMRARAWAFEATVDIGYDLANDADQMTEIARALAYCRTALTA